MADTPATDTGETATSGSVSNDVSTTTAPGGDNGSTAEVERLRKEAEQAKMRANQLANELEAKHKAEEVAKQKQMEEKEEFKTLYEQTQKSLDEMKSQAEADKRNSELKQASNELFKEYPENVQKLAETAGLTLTDDSDEAKAALKAKLDEFKSQVAPVQTTQSNNGYTPSTDVSDPHSLTQRSAPGQPSPMAEASARGDNSVINQYISSLPAIKRMREIAQGS